jgi:hypothetical protein
MKRFSDRMTVNLGAEIILNNTWYEGKIENISKEGIFYQKVL